MSDADVDFRFRRDCRCLASNVFEGERNKGCTVDIIGKPLWFICQHPESCAYIRPGYWPPLAGEKSCLHRDGESGCTSVKARLAALYRLRVDAELAMADLKKKEKEGEE